MSADNWTQCPRCIRRHEKEAERLREKADSSYGAETLDVWKRLDAEAISAAKPLDGSTLREDWDIYGADEGTVILDYGASCSKCGLRLSFKHEVAFEGIEE